MAHEDLARRRARPERRSNGGLACLAPDHDIARTERLERAPRLVLGPRGNGDDDRANLRRFERGYRRVNDQGAARDPRKRLRNLEPEAFSPSRSDQDHDGVAHAASLSSARGHESLRLTGTQAAAPRPGTYARASRIDASTCEDVDLTRGPAEFCGDALWARRWRRLPGRRASRPGPCRSWPRP